MKKIIKSINPIQLGKMLALIYGLSSLLFVPFFLIIPIAGSMLGNQTQTQFPPLIFFGAFAIVSPFLYALMGFITGALGAVGYNLIAKWIGGIEVDVE